MATKIQKFKVQSGVTTSSSTSIFTLCSFDITALPGGITATQPSELACRVKVMQADLAGDHTTRTWERSVLFVNTAGSNLAITATTGTSNSNTNTGGLLGDVDTATIAFDVSGTTIGRVRITPDSANSSSWYCIMEIDCTQMA